MKDTICIFNDRRSGDLICTDFVYETGTVQENTVHHDSHILGIIEGDGGTLFAGGREYLVATGDVFFVPQNLSYRFRFDGEVAYYYIVFCGRRADELISRVSSGGAAIFSARDEYGDILPLCRKCIAKAEKKNRDIFGEALLLYILGHIGSEAAPPDSLLSRIIDITHESYTSAGFSLASLARTLSYDAKYLSQHFKRCKGLGYTAYLRALRLDHAVFLMEQGLVSVKNIAILSGFSDSLYFSKVFKAEKGCSPREYIRLQTGKRQP